MSRLVMGPFNRVEGDLEVTLDVADGQVQEARVNVPLYRGFETLLYGRSPLDALVIAPRICGICSVSQSVAAASALASAMNLAMPDNGRLASNLILATENLADHFTHFHLFFMPDFAREAYRGRPWFPAAEARFKALRGSATADVLPARSQFLTLMGYLAAETIAEDISHSWMMGPVEPLPPAQGVTLPDLSRTGAYSWCKAPRLAGKVVETGALARQVVAGHPLVRDLVAKEGGNVRSRVVARLLELALVLPRMEAWALALRPGEPFCAQGTLPGEGRGVGMMEAARGSLGHWLEIHNGRIHNYQIVSPTTWNFSPRDIDNVPGAVEQALAGTPVGENETEPLAVQHVVRSFDPCMVCTVH